MKALLILLAFLPSMALGFQNVQAKKAAVTAGVMTGTNVVNGATMEVGAIQAAAFQAVWSAGATPIGVLKLQGSTDLTNNPDLVANWTDLPAATFTGTTAVSGNTGSSLLMTITPMGLRWLRVVYTNTSGTGTLNVTYFGKGS